MAGQQPALLDQLVRVLEDNPAYPAKLAVVEGHLQRAKIILSYGTSHLDYQTWFSKKNAKDGVVCTLSFGRNL